jgi:hypothetical protein
MSSQDQIARVIGLALIKRWGTLPQDLQQVLFEEAVAAGHGEDGASREDIAVFLHDHHPRTPSF